MLRLPPSGIGKPFAYIAETPAGGVSSQLDGGRKRPLSGTGIDRGPTQTDKCDYFRKAK
jgi:hypothetical protein